MKAFTRAVSPRIAECELTHLDRVPIDPAKAVAQHAAYERALADAGFEIVRLPELADDPDAVFVEDTALILGDHAVITRPGAASRIGEVDSTAAGLADYFELHRIAHGHVDGGDVLRIGKLLYVGVSTRTDRAGIDALAAIANAIGYEVAAAEAGACLHLKTGAIYAGNGVLLYNRQAIDPGQFAGVEPLPVDEAEPTAANCVRAGDRLILPAGNPRTADALRGRGFKVVEVDVSELQKAEAGVTCMSLIDDR
ncbi:dimethylarginine dimethylaminohydrolase family protein [Sphingomonas sp. URHD0057]|uniref:dimethylarginine dimethylaminohydrolase family protein n=1 Tax=Sphingomonas sp. URHD0057 TaxID=1380389 RepID=UPI0004903089|nr:arginine deiminase family protein [Sphingomonas sp. URHD0057]